MAEQALVALCELNLSDCALGVLLCRRDTRADAPEWGRISITDSLAEELKGIAKKVLDDLRQWIDDDDMELVEHSADHKPDSHQLHHLEWAAHEHIAAMIKAIPSVATAPLIDPRNDEFMDSLVAYALALEPPGGNRCLLFKKCSPSWELGRSNVVAAVFNGSSFSHLKEPVLRFEESADCVLSGDRLFIRRVSPFQQLFNFYEMVRQAATESLKAIKAVVPIANFEEFEAACQTNVHKLAKLRNIAQKPYLKHVKMSDIRRTIKEFGLTGVKVVKKNGKDALEYDAADRWVVLNLLDDNYLGSVMTKQRYLANSKTNL